MLKEKHLASAAEHARCGAPSNELLALKDLQNEIAIMVRLAHPGVLRVLGEGEVQGTPFLVLERLHTVLAAVLPKPADQARACIAQPPHPAQHLLDRCS
jgi:hypothetical protein